MLLYLLDTAKRAAGSVASLGGTHTARDVLVFEQLQVRIHLAREVRFRTRRTEQRHGTTKKTTKECHDLSVDPERLGGFDPQRAAERHGAGDRHDGDDERPDGERDAGAGQEP